MPLLVVYTVSGIEFLGVWDPQVYAWRRSLCLVFRGRALHRHTPTQTVCACSTRRVPHSVPCPEEPREYIRLRISQQTSRGSGKELRNRDSPQVTTFLPKIEEILSV